MKLSAIKPNPDNPRFISEERVERLKKRIEDFPKMFKYRPIVVDNNGVILGGNQRYRALKELGYKEIPDEWVRKASDLTKEEQELFIVADNVSDGEWDLDILRNWNPAVLDAAGLEPHEWDIPLIDSEEGLGAKASISNKYRNVDNENAVLFITINKAAFAVKKTTAEKKRKIWDYMDELQKDETEAQKYAEKLGELIYKSIP